MLKVHILFASLFVGLTAGTMLAQEYPGPLQLKMENGNYYIQRLIPSWARQDDRKVEMIPATVINTANNKVGLEAGNVCAYGQFGSQYETLYSTDTNKNVIVCSMGQVFKNVKTPIKESNGVFIPQQGKYIGSLDLVGIAIRPSSKVMYFAQP